MNTARYAQLEEEFEYLQALRQERDGGTGGRMAASGQHDAETR